MTDKNNRTQRPFQIFDNCIDCEDCVNGCPNEAISKVDGEKTLKFDWTKCEGDRCTQCAEILCPASAIEMIPEPEEDTDE
ncbi:MAG: 4Fe-4S dicluster domain-containing protein [Candidatus Paceibacterota bacterium]|jgi:Pyruvate/2-oxoacid:ferredoxin oxidoreductase delta subunit|nr:4Fe-4S binding protein [Candidatus Paceibacterota bacterium]